MLFSERSIKSIALMLFLNIFCVSQMQAALLISDTPVTILQGSDSKLNRPEGVAFSPGDNCLAVANSGNASITLYPKNGETGSLYKTSPSCVIQNNRILRYAHVVAFTPSGDFLGGVGRESRSTVIFERDSSLESCFYRTPYWKLVHKSKVDPKPAGLCFDPVHGTLIIANRKSADCFEFHNQINGEGSYTTSVSQSILLTDLLADSISVPHDVAISPDGTLLAGVHKKFKGDVYDQGESAITIYEKINPGSPEFNPLPSFTIRLGDEKTHSISFHPSGKYLAITQELTYATIYERVEGSIEFTKIGTTAVDYTGERGLAKGVAFSPDGESLAITFDNDLILIYSVQEL